LFVQVDVNNSIYEANLGDKLSAGVSGTFTLTPPDLMPVSVVAPATVLYTQPNPAITVNWAVTNQGIGEATGGWYDRVWFSTNGVLDAQSVSLGNFYFSQTVAPGTIYWKTNAVTLPMSANGNYTLFVQVDIYNYLYESNETNNISAGVSGTFTLTPPDLMPVSVLQNVGGLTNLQTGFGPFPESLHPYTNNTDQSWTNHYFGAEVSLVTFDPRSAGEAGYDKLHILNGTGNEITGSPFNLGNLAGQTKLVIGDTVVLRLTSDGSVTGWGFRVAQIQSGLFASGAPVVSSMPNPTVQVAWGVTNQGPGTASGSWYDRVWFSTNGVLNSHSVALGNFSISQTVAAGGSYWQTNVVTLPMSASGNYTIFVQVDVNNSIYESDEANNISAGAPGTFTLTSLNFNASSAGMRWTNGGFQFQLDGLAGHGPVIIYASTNFVSWTPIYTNPPITGSIQFLDSRATNFPFRFYRAAEQ
jgi:hypothetical protein